MNPSFTSEAYSPDKLIAGDEKLITRQVTLASGQNTVRGAVLGKKTADGKYILSLSAAVDGSQVARAILAADCDATGGDTACIIYDQGEFNQDQITLGASHTIATVQEDLRAVGIHLKDPVSA